MPALLGGLLDSLTWSVINHHFMPLFPGKGPIDYNIVPEYR